MYSKLPKQLWRNNLRVLVGTIKQDCTNMRQMFDEHMSPDMSYDALKTYSRYWCNRYSFSTIFKEFNLNNENNENYISNKK